MSDSAVAFAAQIWCRPENETRTMDVIFAQSIARAAQPLIEALESSEAALQWASGSADFNTGGKARKGWLHIARPAMAQANEAMKNYRSTEGAQDRNDAR